MASAAHSHCCAPHGRLRLLQVLWRKDDQTCTATSRSGQGSGIRSFGRVSQFDRSFVRRALAPRRSARCSTIHCHSRIGREAAGIQSSALIQARSSGCFGKTPRCRPRPVSLSRPSTSASEIRKALAEATAPCRTMPARSRLTTFASGNMHTTC
jgi:hypothetical protein